MDEDEFESELNEYSTEEILELYCWATISLERDLLGKVPEWQREKYRLKLRSLVNPPSEKVFEEWLEEEVDKLDKEFQKVRQSNPLRLRT